MTSHAETSQSLTAKAATDTSEADSLHAQSFAQAVEAQELQDSAALLESQAQQDASLAAQENAQADSYSDTVNTELSQQNALEAKIASEEVLYEEEMEKASAEGSAATSNTLNSESDGVATSLCEFIPFVDMLCDFVGGVAAMGFTSKTAKFTAQSALDYTSAAATKSQEDVDVAELDTLNAQMAENKDVEAGLETKAKQEQLKARQEEARAQEQMQEEAQKQNISKEEEIESEEEMATATEEGAQAEKEINLSIDEGMQALKDALFAGVFSTLVLLFFAIRIFTVMVIPVTAAVFGFIPFAMTMMNSSNVSNYTSPMAASASTQKIGNLHVNARNTRAGNSIIYNIWMALPRRETSYFVLHCGIYISTMSIWFCKKFQNLHNVDVRSRGGTLLLFALVASTIQGLLLHSIPYFVSKVKEIIGDHTRCFIVSGFSMIGGTIFKLLKAIIHLTPLFICEATTLWLIFGKCIFSFHLPPPLTPVKVGTSIFIASILYIILFEISFTENNDDFILIQDDDVHYNRSYGNDSWGIESKDSLIDETKNLLQNDMNHNTQRYNLSVSSDLEKVESKADSEVCASTEDTKVVVCESASCTSQISSRFSFDHNNNKNIEEGFCSTIDEGIDDDQQIYDRRLVTSTSYQSSNNIIIQHAVSCSSYTGMSYREEITIKSEDVEVHKQRSVCNDMQTAIDQYFSDLKLPFEILVMTCMIVLLRGCIPTLIELLPKIICGHKFFFLEVVGVVVGISIILWFLLRTNDKRGGLGLWTGDALRH